MAGELLCFQFTVRLNLQRLTRLIYFVAGGARRARSEIWMRSFPVNKTPWNLQEAASRGRVVPGLDANAGVSWALDCGAQARGKQPVTVSPLDDSLCSPAAGTGALAGFEHELGGC